MRKRKKNPHDPVDDAVGWLAWKKKELKDDMERYGYDPGGDADKAAAQQADTLWRCHVQIATAEAAAAFAQTNMWLPKGGASLGLDL